MNLVKLAIAIFLVALLSSTASNSFALDKDVQLEIRRLEQHMAKIITVNKKLTKDIRVFERELEKAQKAVEDIHKKNENLTDSIIKLKNVDISNLRAGQKALYDQLPVLDWGADTEECPKIDAQHQQIKQVRDATGRKTVKFLCFDGKPLHLSTELETID